MTQTPEVSVIVVNWNGREHLDGLFSSLARQSHSDFELVFVDNGSTDDSLARVREHLAPAASFPVRLVPLGANTGFARGNNEGLGASTGRFVVTLNNDTEVHPDWLGCLAEEARRHPGALCASRILDYFDRGKLDSLGLEMLPDGMSCAAHRGEPDPGPAASPAEVLLPSACAALYPRAVLDRIGPFDEAFFAYCEDTDLGLRALWAGHRTRLAAGAAVYHKYSASAGRLSARKAYLVERNHLWVILKNLPAPDAARALAATGVRYGLLAAGLLSGRGPAAGLAREEGVGSPVGIVLKAWRDALRRLPAVRAQRREIARSRAVPAGVFRALLRRHTGSLRALAFGTRVG